MQLQADSALMNAPGARTDAERLLSSAEGFASIADAAVAGAGPHAFAGSHTAVLFFLLAQAAEIAMKAWLVMDGVSLSDIRKLGHDLEGILVTARADGFAPGFELAAAQFSLLNRVYDRAKTLQYPVGDGFVLPPRAATRAMVDSFISAAALKVRGQVDRSRLGASIGFGALY
jgi:hypothetical protein